jgi:hypothetical protein
MALEGGACVESFFLKALISCQKAGADCAFMKLESNIKIEAKKYFFKRIDLIPFNL